MFLILKIYFDIDIIAILQVRKARLREVNQDIGNKTAEQKDPELTSSHENTKITLTAEQPSIKMPRTYQKRHSTSKDIEKLSDVPMAPESTTGGVRIPTPSLCIHRPFFFFFFFFFFCCLGPHLQHMEVPKLGVESELQLPAHTTASHSNARSKPRLRPTPQPVAMPDP